MTFSALQYVASVSNQAIAVMTLHALRLQDGCIGGRVLAPGPGKPTWRVQTFHADDGTPEQSLPTGMRRVWIPATAKSALGIH